MLPQQCLFEFIILRSYHNIFVFLIKCLFGSLIKHIRPYKICIKINWESLNFSLCIFEQTKHILIIQSDSINFQTGRYFLK